MGRDHGAGLKFQFLGLRRAWRASVLGTGAGAACRVVNARQLSGLNGLS